MNNDKPQSRSGVRRGGVRTGYGPHAHFGPDAVEDDRHVCVRVLLELLRTALRSRHHCTRIHNSAGEDAELSISLNASRFWLARVQGCCQDSRRTAHGQAQ